MSQDLKKGIKKEHDYSIDTILEEAKILRTRKKLHEQVMAESGENTSAVTIEAEQKKSCEQLSKDKSKQNQTRLPDVVLFDNGEDCDLRNDMQKKGLFTRLKLKFNKKQEEPIFEEIFSDTQRKVKLKVEDPLKENCIDEESLHKSSEEQVLKKNEEEKEEAPAVFLATQSSKEPGEKPKQPEEKTQEKPAASPAKQSPDKPKKDQESCTIDTNEGFSPVLEGNPLKSCQEEKRQQQNDQKAQIKKTREKILLLGEDPSKVIGREYQQYSKQHRKKRERLTVAQNSDVVLRQTEKSVSVSQQKKSVKQRKSLLFGEQEELNAEKDKKKHDRTLIQDYETKEDVPRIRKELNQTVRSMLVRSAVTGFSMLLLVVATVLIRFYPSSLQVVPGTDARWLFLICNFSLLTISLLVSFSTIRNGFSSLFRLQGNADSAVAFASVCTFLQSLLALFFPGEFVTPGLIPIYASLLCVELFFHALGNLYIALRVQKNFQFATASFPKYAAKFCRNDKILREISSEIGVREPAIAYQKRTRFLSDFLKNSYLFDPSDYLSSVMTPVGVGLCILIGLLEWILTGDILIAVSALTVNACIAVPVTGVLALHLPLFSLCKKALKKGAMLTGFGAIKQFSNVNEVVFDALDLYPTGAVRLVGLKTFGGQRIDEALLCAAAVVYHVGGPMQWTFDQIIQGRHKILPKVESVSYEDKQGLLGWVENKRVLIGNRQFLEKYGIDALPLNDEKKYRKGGYDLIYFASGGKLVAMFVLHYQPDGKIAKELERLEYNGVNVLIKTMDPNITAEKIARDFELYFQTVKVLPIRLTNQLNEFIKKPDETTKTYLVTKGRMESFARILSGCIRLKSNSTLTVLIQEISVILGFVMVAFLTFYAGVTQIGAVELLLYLLFWILASLIVPRIRKP